MKRMITVLLAVILIAGSAVNASAFSSDLTDTGKTVTTIGDWVYEKINHDTEWELDEYIGEGGDIIAPRDLVDLAVVAFGNYCFANNTNVKSVKTMSPLWTIGDYCFINCTTLEKIELNYALHTIGTGAFSGTSALKDINLEDSIVTKIEPYTFLNSGIEEVALPDTCTEIGQDAFAQCESLTKVTIPASVTTIHEDAFRMSDNVVIYAPKDSYAIEYAKANNIPYVEMLTVLCGDADGDNVITILDATRIQRILADLEIDEDGMMSLRGDVNGDGLDILDATKIQRYLVQLEVDCPIAQIITVQLTV